MQNIDSCNNSCDKPVRTGTSAGLLIVVVLYILLAIIFGSWTRY